MWSDWNDWIYLLTVLSPRGISIFPVYNKVSPNILIWVFWFAEKKEGAPLKIIRMSHVAGGVEGGKEVWLLSDKVDGKTA